MSQRENRSMMDQLACCDQVREAGIALSRKITSLTTEHEQSTVSSKIFRTLLPACFQQVRVRTEATFSELNTNLPSLLCRFVTPDQAGQILASIFTYLCNYNTEICGMAMVQTVVSVYTIPNTYRVQQSLWESLCRIIPGIARTSGSELRSFEPVASRNTAVGQSGMVPGTRSSSDPGTGTAGLGNVAVSLSTCQKSATQETHPASLLDGISPEGSKWAMFHQHIPRVNLTDDGDPPDARPQETSTPIKTTPVPERHLSGKKLNISKIKVTHLLFDMQDRQEWAWKSVEAEKNQPAVSNRTSGKEHSSGGDSHTDFRRHCLICQGETGCPPCPQTQLRRLPSGVPSALMMMMMMRSWNFQMEASWPGFPRRRKRKRKVRIHQRMRSLYRRARMADHTWVPQRPNRKVIAEEPTPVPALSRVPAEEDKISKKKKKKQKKKEADLERFQLEQAGG